MLQLRFFIFTSKISPTLISSRRILHAT